MSCRQRLILFDVDGTLTPSRLPASPEIISLLHDLRQNNKIAVVTGSDFPKMKEQLGDDVLEKVDFAFCENGLDYYSDGKSQIRMCLTDRLPKERLDVLAAFCMKYIDDLDLPAKTSNFVEIRSGMVNVCPVGRACSQDQRIEFWEYDKIHKIRENFIRVLQTEFAQDKLVFAQGGQISIDIYPEGWSKVFCIQYIEGKFDEIHFFGDRTEEGGNDYEIAHDPRIIPHPVKNPKDTEQICRALFK